MYTSMHINRLNQYLRKTPLALAVMASVGSVSSVSAEEFALEEIVVTAQKRAQSLQDVPISVSAVGGEKLSEAGIENLQDLSAYVPNLKIVEGGLVPQMFIRGIGSSANQGFEQSVGTYSDGIYMGRSLQSRSSFMDLERVEVLRGPQSILFGQSSIAGAISLVSAKPTDEFEGMISASYADKYNEQEVNGYVSGPLTDTLKARLALRDRQEDGYIENVLRDEDTPAIDEQAARLTLVWEPTEELLAELKLESARLDRKGRPTQAVDLGTYPDQVAGLVDNAKLDYKTYSNEDNEMEFDSDTVVLKLEYAVGDHTLTSITGYSEYEYQEDNYDAESTELAVVALDMSEDFEQFSQEFRLTSPGGETIDYIVGAFFQKSEQKYTEDASLQISALNPANVYFDSLLKRPFEVESETVALFGQATWNVSEQLRVTFGLRYTEDEKEGSRSQEAYSLNIAPGVSQNDVIIPIGPLAGLPVSTVLAGNGDAFGPVASLGYGMQDHSLSGKSDKSNWTPSLNIQYDFSDDIMLYATYSEGYKAGGFDARGGNGFSAGATDSWGRSYSTLSLGAENFEFDQEEAETIEIGAKMSVLDGAGELNVALFHTDYTDMQVSVYDGIFGFNVLNAGAATVRGLEMDGRWRPTESLLLTAGLAYLDFEWTDYQEGPCPAEGDFATSPSGNCVFDGKENNHTPEWTVNLSANHSMMITDALELRSTLDANFKDNHYVANNLDDRSEQSAVTIFNARVALASTDDTWQVALTGKNLTDQTTLNYMTNLSLSGGGMTGQVGRPRTIGIEGSYRF
jgi:iron complex outermembrane recepter protein